MGMTFPVQRPRRLRNSTALRHMVAETCLDPAQLIQPLFLVPGRGITNPISTLPGNSHWSVDRVVDEGKRLADLGITSVLLFGSPTGKDARGSEAWSEHGIVQQACRALREAVPQLVLITDVCLCAYTDHGHCGVLERQGSQWRIDNDATLPLLAQTAVSHAKAGAHIVAPSDMMDGRVGAIRQALDAEACSDIAIMSYAVKYQSAYYGPFREAQHSSPSEGDRASYQMDPANAREAIREALLDVAEGADIIMVKPAMPYLDIVRAVREVVQVPVAAYQVSGEYAMIKAAAAQGLLDGPKAMREALLGIRRAGADLIITYAAAEYASLHQ